MIPFADADVHPRSTPVVTRALIGLNGLVFLYELYLGGLGLLTGGGDFDITRFFFTWGFIPDELAGGQPFRVLDYGFARLDIETPAPTWATLFSSMFIHGGFFHLAGNMMFLWVFGDKVEALLGRLGFLLFYLASGAAAALSHLAIDAGSQTPLVGASGAVSGVLGAYLLSYPYNRVKALILMFVITVIELPAVWLLGGWFVWQLVQGIYSLGLANAVNVAFFAHVGGFIAGLLLMGAFRLGTGRPLWPGRNPRASQPGPYRPPDRDWYPWD